MIKLQLHGTGEAYYMNPDKVVGIFEYSESETLIEQVGGEVRVFESPEEVSRLITEYKQRQMRLQAAYMALYKDTMGSYLEEEIISHLESRDRGE